MTTTIRSATTGDVAALVPLVQASIGTYFVVEVDAAITGCGGWSRRATLYAGDHSAGRDAAYGFQPVEDVEDASGVAVPLTRMRKPVTVAQPPAR